MVIWLIGMSASGKTSIGTALFNYLKNNSNDWVLLDGDTFRNIFNNDLGHTVEDRRKNAYRISNLCLLLNKQGINVVACVLSIFHDNQQFNRENISDYKEIYIDVDQDTLLKRDKNNLYSRAIKGEIKNVVGVDIPFNPPINPDIVINNNSSTDQFDSIVKYIVDKLNIRLDKPYKYSLGNRLTNPERYQYTNYEGKDFLNKYVASRNEAASILKEGLEDLSGMTQLEDEEPCPENFTDNDELITKYYFRNLLDKVLNKKLIEVDEKSIFQFIKIFEVSKKLYTKYDYTNFKKSSDDFYDIYNYLLFSEILINYYRLYGNMYTKHILFNTILKINDLIISAIIHLHTPVHKKAALENILAELEIFDEIKGMVS